MAGRLDGKVAVVTGGASGIGLCTVERFVEEGAAVVFSDLSPEGGREANTRLGSALHHGRRAQGGHNDGEAIAARLGEQAAFVAADVTDAEQMGAVFACAQERFGGLDILVNNAGIGTHEGPIAEIPEALTQRVLDVNLKGVFLAMQQAVPLLRQRGSGSIINMSSILGLRAWPNQSIYCATKGAVISLSRAAAVELAPDHIRVNAVCPGVINTPIYSDMPAGVRVDPQALDEHFAAQQPLPRAGQPLDVANMVLFLASQESCFVTGQQLVVDGGMDAQVFSGDGYTDFVGGILKLMVPES